VTLFWLGQVVELAIAAKIKGMRKFLLSLILFSSLTGLVRAQDETTTPTPENTGIMSGIEVRVWFPAVLEFNANIAARPEEIESSQIRLFQTGGYEYTVPIDVESTFSLRAIDTGRVSVLVPLDSENRPRPFEPLNYRWSVTGTDGEVSEARGEVLFQTPDFEWRSAGDPPLGFTSYGDLGIGVLRDELLRVYDRLALDTRETPSFRFVVYRFGDVSCDTSTDTPTIPNSPGVPCSIEDLRDYYAANGLIFFQPSGVGFEVTQNELTTELVSAFYAPSWSVEVPAWFERGLGQLYRPTGNYPALVTGQGASANNALFSLETLATPLPLDADPNQRVLWDAESYLLVLYLADTYGADAPFRLASELEDAESFEAAFEAVTDGATVTDVYRRWEVWLSSGQAESAALWHPYLATTPTVTPTSTNTSIPPTRTPTLTPTITLTPTSTSLIDRLPTVPPTASMSPTVQISLTPSVTALPAGSLMNPTPTPAPADSGEGNLPCGISAVIAPAIGLALAMRAKKKQW
jgi:hypothetical protein